MQARRAAEGGVEAVADPGGAQRPVREPGRRQRKDQRGSAAPRHDPAHGLKISFSATAKYRTGRQGLVANQGENAVETQRRQSATEAGARSAMRAAAMTPRPTLKTLSGRAPGERSSRLRTRKRSRSTRKQTRW